MVRTHSRLVGQHSCAPPASAAVAAGHAARCNGAAACDGPSHQKAAALAPLPTHTHTEGSIVAGGSSSAGTLLFSEAHLRSGWGAVGGGGWGLGPSSLAAPGRSQRHPGHLAATPPADCRRTDASNTPPPPLARQLLEARPVLHRPATARPVLQCSATAGIARHSPLASRHAARSANDSRQQRTMASAARGSARALTAPRSQSRLALRRRGWQ